MRPGEVLTGTGIVLRRYVVADAHALHLAITESIEHLRPWMPWIQWEPLRLADREALIRDRFTQGWADDTDYGYGIFVGDVVVGGCGLHRRIADDGLEIGYWVHVAHTGRGLATEASRVLTQAAFALDGITHVEIHHDKANVASGRVPQKLGFTLVCETEDEVSAPAESGIDCQWRLERITSS